MSACSVQLPTLGQRDFRFLFLPFPRQGRKRALRNEANPYTRGLNLVTTDLQSICEPPKITHKILGTHPSCITLGKGLTVQRGWESTKGKPLPQAQVDSVCPAPQSTAWTLEVKLFHLYFNSKELEFLSSKTTTAQQAQNGCILGNP